LQLTCRQLLRISENYRQCLLGNFYVMKMYTIKEAKAYLNCSERTIYNWRKKGKLPDRKHFGHPYFLEEDLLDGTNRVGIDIDRHSIVYIPLIYFPAADSLPDRIQNYFLANWGGNISTQDAAWLSSVVFEFLNSEINLINQNTKNEKLRLGY
jgi:excisionase family DNA binding protein